MLILWVAWWQTCQKCLIVTSPLIIFWWFCIVLKLLHMIPSAHGFVVRYYEKKVSTSANETFQMSSWTGCTLSLQGFNVAYCNWCQALTYIFIVMPKWNINSTQRWGRVLTMVQDNLDHLWSPLLPKLSKYVCTQLLCCHSVPTGNELEGWIMSGIKHIFFLMQSTERLADCMVD